MSRRRYVCYTSDHAQLAHLFHHHRLDSSGVPRRLHVLQRDEQSPDAEEGDRTEQVEVQVWIPADGDCGDFGDAGGHGGVSDV